MIDVGAAGVSLIAGAKKVREFIIEDFVAWGEAGRAVL